MPAFTAKPRPVPPKGGVKMSLREGPGGVYVAITISAEMQERGFGRRLQKGEPVTVTLNSDPSRRHLMMIAPDENGEIQVGGAPCDAVKLETAAWRGCPAAPHKSTACPPLASRGGVIAVRLPDWARVTGD